MIIERIREYGVPIRRIVCAGGIAEKNPLLMQIYADVTGCTLHVAGSSQACALGAAISAAVLCRGAPRFRRGAEGDDPARKRTPTGPMRAGARSTTASMRSTRPSTTDSAGVRKRADLSRVMKELLAIQAGSRGPRERPQSMIIPRQIRNLDGDRLPAPLRARAR